MVALYLTEYAIHDVMNEPDGAAACLEQLEATTSSLEAIFALESPQIKRLSGIRSPVPFFRFRKGMQRVIFTPAAPHGKEGLVVWRIGLRDRIYEDLERLLRFFDFAVDWPVTELFTNPEGFEASIEDATPTTQPATLPLPSWDRYYQPPLAESWVEYVSSGEYHYRPCLTPAQQQWVSDCLSAPTTTFAVQGAAGTGKTTMALALAIQAAADYVPIVIVPNARSAHYAQRWLWAHHPTLNVASHDPNADIVVTTIALVLGSRHQEANQYLRSLLQRQGGAEPGSDIDLHGIVRGYLSEGAYPEPERELLPSAYAAIASRLATLWNDQHNKALADGWGTTPEPWRSPKPPLLIIDEVQDLFWFQVRSLIETFAPQRLVIMGDRNQRVVLSGFSWPALARVLARDLSLQLPTCYQPERNFRNTRSITRVANYLLLDAFSTAPARQRYSLPDPDSCVEVGEKPRLLAADPSWLEAMLLQLQMSLTHLPPNVYFVFLAPDDAAVVAPIQRLDSDRLLIYSISDAKGQEFNGAILLNPFSAFSQPPTSDDLHHLYTAITRVRRHLSILVAPDTLQWLTKTLGEAQLKALFDLRPLHPAAFVSELQQEARSFLTREQRRAKFVADCSKQAYRWLSGASPYVPWELQLDLSWSELGEALAVLTADSAQSLSRLPDDLDRLQPLQQWALYRGFSALVQDSEALARWEALLCNQLATLPESVRASLSAPQTEPVLSSLLWQAAGDSWQAAAAIASDPAASRRIEAIAQALETKELPYEAKRLRVQYAQASAAAELPYAELLTQPGPLVELACERYCHALKTLLETLP